MKTTNYILAFTFILLGISLNAQTDTVYIIPDQTIVGNQVRVDFPVQQFEGIVCLQYTMNYDPNILQFDDIGNLNLPNLNENSFGQPAPGKITFSWLDFSTMGVSRADGESIYSVFFSMAGGAGVSELFIDGSFTAVEACISTQTIPLIFSNISIAAFVTSNEEVETAAEVNIFPNPATDQVTFDIGTLSGNVKLEIYNSIGQLISNQKMNGSRFSLNKSMQMDSGTYYYRIAADGEPIKMGKFTFL